MTTLLKMLCMCLGIAGASACFTFCIYREYLNQTETFEDTELGFEDENLEEYAYPDNLDDIFWEEIDINFDDDAVIKKFSERKIHLV